MSAASAPSPCLPDDEPAAKQTPDHPGLLPKCPSAPPPFFSSLGGPTPDPKKRERKASKMEGAEDHGSSLQGLLHSAGCACCFTDWRLNLEGRCVIRGV